MNRHIVTALSATVAGLAMVSCGSGLTPGASSRSDTAATGTPNSVQHAYNPGTDKAPSSEVAYSGPKLALQYADVGATAAEPTIGIANDGTAYFAASHLVVDTA